MLSRLDGQAQSPATGSSAVSAWRASYLSLPALAWVAIWLGINSGPAILYELPENAYGWANFLRTALPLAMLVCYAIPLLRESAGELPLGPLKLWLLYGILGAGTCLLSPEPLDAAYWAGCYLAVFAGLVAYLQRPDPLRRAVELNYLSWVVAAVFLSILLAAARDVLFVGSGLEMTAYGIYGRMSEIGGMAMSRSSGLARFTAVPGLAAFVLLWSTRGGKRLLCLGVWAGSACLIWTLQSRGAMAGFFAAMAFAMLFLGPWSRLVGIFVLVLMAGVASGLLVSEQTYEQLMLHVTRGQDPEEFRSMTGRTLVWNYAWDLAKANPLGRGPQADRFLMYGEHVHNTYLYALLEAGFAGAALFIAGLGWAWVLFIRAIRSRVPELLGQRAFLVQVGVVLAFFTVRSIPEVCGAMYGVDTMVMLPAIAYLALLDREVRARAARLPRPSPASAGRMPRPRRPLAYGMGIR